MLSLQNVKIRDPFKAFWHIKTLYLWHNATVDADSMSESKHIETTTIVMTTDRMAAGNDPSSRPQRPQSLNATLKDRSENSVV